MKHISTATDGSLIKIKGCKQAPKTKEVKLAGSIVMFMNRQFDKGLQRLINLYSVVISCSIVDAFDKYFVVKHNLNFSISSHALIAVNLH